MREDPIVGVRSMNGSRPQTTRHTERAIARELRREVQSSLTRRSGLPPVYLCRNPGESYSAAYLAKIGPSFFRHPFNISPRQHMESGASVWHNGHIPFKSLDLMEFGVEHLSWLERFFRVSSLPRATQASVFAALKPVISDRARRLKGQQPRWTESNRYVCVSVRFVCREMSLVLAHRPLADRRQENPRRFSPPQPRCKGKLECHKADLDEKLRPCGTGV